MVECLVFALLEPHVVEDEKLELGGQQAPFGQTRAPHVADGLARDVPGVARIILVGDRILDIADHRQRGLGHERVNKGRLGLRNDQQIGLVDGTPADNAGAIERDAFLERLLGQRVGRVSRNVARPRENP